MHQLKFFYIELNLQRNKWLLFGSYNAHRNTIHRHLNFQTTRLVLYLSTYENFIAIGVFNVQVDDTAMLDSCSTFDRVSLIKDSLCNKNPEKLFWIDFILKNEHHIFKTHS